MQSVSGRECREHGSQVGLLTQVQLEGEKYVTGSLTIPMIEQLRVGLQAACGRLQEFESAVGVDV